MDLKTITLLVRLLIVIIGVWVLVSSVITLIRPDIEIRFVGTGFMTCVVLVIIHENLLRKVNK